MTWQQQAEQIVSQWWGAFGASARLSEEARDALIQETMAGLAAAAADEQKVCISIAEELKGAESEFGPLHAIGLAEAAERIADRIRSRGK